MKTLSEIIGELNRGPDMVPVAQLITDLRAVQASIFRQLDATQDEARRTPDHKLLNFYSNEICALKDTL